MIFRKEPLLDAEWLLGPIEPQPRSIIRKDVCAVIIVTTVAIVAGWNQLSNRILANQGATQIASNVASPTSCFPQPEQPTSVGSLARIDESHIRIVDRFVPRNRSDSGNTNNKVAIRNVSLPISLPIANLNSAVESHFEIADIRTDANPVVPLDLLAIRMVKPDEQLTLNSDVDSVGEGSDQLAGAYLVFDKTPQAIRTVSYKGKPTLDEQPEVSSEPPRMSGNVRKLSSSETSDQGSLESEIQASDENQLSGLENRSTGDVVRLLGSVQPRLAGAAINELKRRGFGDTHLQLAVDLASGRRETRIAAMEKLVSEQNVSPLPWLIWMAEDDDRKIREHSIRLMSTMPGEEVRRQMRLLMNREKDAGLYDLLRKASISSGAVSTNYEKKR